VGVLGRWSYAPRGRAAIQLVGRVPCHRRVPLGRPVARVREDPLGHGAEKKPAEAVPGMPPPPRGGPARSFPAFDAFQDP